jgi:exonuclease SbcC
MRPKLLRFAGIGPFRHEEVIDFEHLDAAGLYLIVGPTGAGKTTIFEAMTYALFAKVPSDLFPTNDLLLSSCFHTMALTTESCATTSVATATFTNNYPKVHALPSDAM